MDWVITVFVNLVVCSTNAVVCGQTCQYGMGYGHSYCRWLYYQQQHSESAYLCQLVKVTDPAKFLKLDISRSGTQNSPFSSLAVAVTIASTYCAWPRRDGQAELAWLAGYVVKQFTCPKAVTIPLLTGLNVDRDQRVTATLNRQTVITIVHISTFLLYF